MLGTRGRAAVVVAAMAFWGLGGGCREDSGDRLGLVPNPPVTPDPSGDGGVDADAPAAETGDSAAPDLGPAVTHRLTILHTNDLHSHLQGHAPEADYTPLSPNDDDTVGGFARLATAIGMHRAAAVAAKEDVLLLDGGDFMMGTFFQFVSTRAAAELRLMQLVGYDAVAMGNHELDWTTAGLAGILTAAAMNQITLPVLASNIVFDETSPNDDALAMHRDGLLKRKLVKTLPGSNLKVGFFGLLGAQAQRFTGPVAAPLTFTKIEVAAAQLAEELRTIDKVDLVVALSHSGISANGQGEDRQLAKAVPGIDIIVSGHTHDKLEQPVVEGKTIIVTAGSYGQYLGRLALEVDKRGDVTSAVRVREYQLLPIDDKITGDATTDGAVNTLIGQIDTNILVPGGLAYKKVVATTTVDVPGAEFAESGLGNFITDAFLATAKSLDAQNDPTQIAVEANGNLRGAIRKGKTGRIWFADLFRLTPLGIGPDRGPGTPLVTYYLHGRDLRNGLEVSAAAKDTLQDDAFTLQFAGMEADYDVKKLAFQRVTAIRLKTATGTEPIDINNTTKCYKVVTTHYLAGLFGLAGQLTGLPVQGKEKDCVTPVDINAHILDRDPATAGVQELKNYQAVLGYVGRLPDSDADQIPNIPAVYGAAQGRIKILNP